MALDERYCMNVLEELLKIDSTTGQFREIQDYVKTHTAPYKYPRIIAFREDLPKTISGKIMRNKL